MRHFLLLLVFIFCSNQAAYAARIVNADAQPRQFKVKSGNETKTIMLKPGQSYFTGPENATVTSQDGKTLELKGTQKSVIRDGKSLLWRGKQTPGNNRPAGYQ